MSAAVRVRVRVPAAVAAYLADRRDWLAHDALVDGHAPTAWRVVVVTVRHAAHAWAAYADALVCGHDYEDGDPGDPEVGPAPDVACVKCGRRP